MTLAKESSGQMPRDSLQGQGASPEGRTVEAVPGAWSRAKWVSRRFVARSPEARVAKVTQVTDTRPSFLHHSIPDDGEKHQTYITSITSPTGPIHQVPLGRCLYPNVAIDVSPCPL